MIYDHSPQFQAQQDALLRQYRCNQRKDDMNATENIAISALPVRACAENDEESQAVVAVRAMLFGIDADGALPDPTGRLDTLAWWETSEGAKFGRQKLAEVEALVRQLEAERDALRLELEAVGAGGVQALLLDGGPPGSGGWKSHAEAMELERDHYRLRAQTMYEHQQGQVWYWQGDGLDNLHSLCNSLPVVIRADQLRRLLAAPQQGGPSTEHMIELVAAAQAVVQRWHSTSWKDTPTADYINRLERALNAAPQHAAPAVELSPDGKELAKTTAGYAHVQTMLALADGQGAGPFWYGWALREAFVAGAEWQEARGTAEVLGWLHEDELPESYPYSAMYPHSKVDVVRMFPVFGPHASIQNEASKSEADSAANLRSKFNGMADTAYCNYIKQLQSDVCLGWETKVKNGKFGVDELQGHTKAAEFLGRHRALAEAADELEKIRSSNQEIKK